MVAIIAATLYALPAWVLMSPTARGYAGKGYSLLGDEDDSSGDWPATSRSPGRLQAGDAANVPGARVPSDVRGGGGAAAVVHQRQVPRLRPERERERARACDALRGAPWTMVSRGGRS